VIMRMPFVAVVLSALPIAAASPITWSETHIRSDGAEVRLGERPEDRTAVVVMCIVYTFMLAFAQGYRAGRIASSKSETKVSDVLVFAQGFISIVFILAVGIKTAGLGISTESQCQGAIWLCIALYGASKMLLYLFLLERIHIVRAPFIDRSRDPIYVVGTFLTVGVNAAIMAYEFKDPITELSRETGLCRIGVQPHAAIAIMVFDTMLNIALTAIFAWQVRPAIKADPARTLWYPDRAGSEQRLSRRRRVRCMFRERTAGLRRMSMRRSIRIMLIRNVVGSSLLLVITATNNIVYLTWSSANKSHICLLMCMSDVALSMLITNWLTMRSLVTNHDSTPSSFITSDFPYDGTSSPRYIRSQHSSPSRTLGDGESSSQLGVHPSSIGPRELKLLQSSLHLNPR
ncbi:hypothetical protein J1614_009555, partial [Plenodomus biglobosus]